MDTEAYEIIEAFIELTECDPEADNPGTDLWLTLQRAKLYVGAPDTTFGLLKPE